MVVILSLVVAVVFGWYWWRGTAYGAFVLSVPIVISGLIIGSQLTAAGVLIAAVVAGLALLAAWGPYLVKNRRPGSGGSWGYPTMEEARARVADLDQWMRENPGSWSGPPADGTARRLPRP